MPDPADADLFSPLDALEGMGQGPADYFLKLRKNPDVCVAVGAWCVLLDQKQLTFRSDLWPDVLALCRYGAIKQRAFEFFENLVMEHELAERAAETPSAPGSEDARKGMLSELSFDYAAGAEAAGGFYLATGDVLWLDQARHRAELLGGWRSSIPWTIRKVLLKPTDADAHCMVLYALDGAGQGDLLDAYSRILDRLKLLPQIAMLFRAAAALRQRNAKLCLERLVPLDSPKGQADAVLKPMRATILQLKAEAEEKAGQFQAAYANYVAMNACDVPADLDPEDHYRRTVAKAQLKIPLLPPEPRSDIVQMLGFPRSGTTLLENVLGSHPLIETFEEIPALRAGVDMIDFVLVGRAPQPRDPAKVFLDARAKYYEELELRRRKPEALVLIDKLPLRSSEAEFLIRLFPDWRYIFSIRHPFDVVLSCFKQRFSPNAAMENFRSIEKTVRAYDHAMTEWFAIHAMDDPGVHYVRYHELVTDFERVTGGVLDFLGVEWDDSVQDFAAGADRRAARTPSYQKVRQGLSIGVQSQWRNYRFVFDADVCRPLHKWAEFFGYDVT